MQVMGELETTEVRERARSADVARTHRQAVSAVLADVLHRQWTHPDGWVAVRLSKRWL